MFQSMFFRIQAVLIFFLFFLGSQALAAEYQHSVSVNKMDFSWSLAGDQLAVKISAPTEGWVAIGFNPTSKMKDANILIGSVKKGKVKISDEYGKTAVGHSSDKKLGGSSDVTVVGGSEENGKTTLEFTIPLNSGDTKADNVIDPAADTAVIMAYGAADSFRVGHGKDRVKFMVNLTTGEKK